MRSLPTNARQQQSSLSASQGLIACAAALRPLRFLPSPSLIAGAQPGPRSSPACPPALRRPSAAMEAGAAAAERCSPPPSEASSAPADPPPPVVPPPPAELSLSTAQLSAASGRLAGPFPADSNPLMPALHESSGTEGAAAQAGGEGSTRVPEGAPPTMLFAGEQAGAAAAPTDETGVEAGVSTTSSPPAQPEGSSASSTSDGRTSDSPPPPATSPGGAAVGGAAAKGTRARRCSHWRQCIGRQHAHVRGK